MRLKQTYFLKLIPCRKNFLNRLHFTGHSKVCLPRNSVNCIKSNISKWPWEEGQRSLHSVILWPSSHVSFCVLVYLYPLQSTVILNIVLCWVLWIILVSYETWSGLGEPQIHSGLGGRVGSLGLSQLWLVPGVGDSWRGNLMGQSPSPVGSVLTPGRIRVDVDCRTPSWY